MPRGVMFTMEGGNRKMAQAFSNRTNWKDKEKEIKTNPRTKWFFNRKLRNSKKRFRRTDES